MIQHVSVPRGVLFFVLAVATPALFCSGAFHPLQRREKRLLSCQLRAKKRPSGSKSGSSLKGFAAPKINIETDRSETARQFYDYLVDNKVTSLASTTLGFFGPLRGVVALTDIPKGQPIIDIPFELAINLGPQGEDPTDPAIEFLKDYSKVMTSERHERKPYYSMLPQFRTDCLGSTDFFDESTLLALQSPSIHQETHRRRERVYASFDKVKDLQWIDGSPLTQEHLQWAVWVVTSRVLTVQGDEASGDTYRLLIPYLDMCNHDRKSPHILTGRAVPGGRLKVVAGQKVKAGQQINICYGGGVAGNDRFIQDYGFLDEDMEGYDITAQQLMGKRRIQEGASAGRAILPSDREASLELLRQTTIEEDMEILESSMSPSIRSAIQYRIGLKKAIRKIEEL